MRAMAFESSAPRAFATRLEIRQYFQVVKIRRVLTAMRRALQLGVCSMIEVCISIQSLTEKAALGGLYYSAYIALDSPKFRGRCCRIVHAAGLEALSVLALIVLLVKLLISSPYSLRRSSRYLMGTADVNEPGRRLSEFPTLISIF